MVSIYSLPSHTLHIRCPIPVVQRTANQITSPYPSKKGKKVSITPISSTKNRMIFGGRLALWAFATADTDNKAMGIN